MRSILFKILALVLLTNISLWIFFLASDDFVQNQIKNKKDHLYVTSLLYGQMAAPILSNPNMTEFEKKVEIGNVFSDRGVVNSKSVNIYRFEAGKSIGGWFKYFDGASYSRQLPIKISSLEPVAFEENDATPSAIELFVTGLFNFYKPLVDRTVLTDPMVEERSRFFSQTEVLNDFDSNYVLRTLAPIRKGRETIGIVEVRDHYGIQDAYLGRNKIRLRFLGGVTVITLALALALSTSIAFPLRRLSKRLDQKISPTDISEQLEKFGIKDMAVRRDEIGQLHQSLVKLTSQVVGLFKAKEQFAAEITHELKNPIASIIAYAETFEGHAGPGNREIMKIKAQAARMNKLVTEISEAAIVDNDLVMQKRERFDFTNTISEIFKHYEDTNQYIGLRFVHDIQPNVIITGLQERWGQVIVNLLDNAVSFAQPEGVIRVTLNQHAKKSISFVVEDSGPGVPEEMTEQIFERFFSSRSGVALQKNASGLGLALVKQIVEAHEGNILVERSSLGGARFVILL